MEQASNLLPQARDEQRLLPQHGERVADAPDLAGSRDQVEVVVVHESWWPTRQKQGVHVLNLTDTQLELAKWVALRAGTNTVYHYKKL